ncbi:MAG TPA: TraR/DksA C4-type zinc finger protein [Candidatus Fimivivens sp.]|nr:TraR/DksA C4-type zinc finger protein [Candidatus Fimivivens sp.]
MTISNEFREEMKAALLAEKSRLEGELSRFADKTEVPGEYEARFEDIGSDRDDNATEVEQYSDNVALEDNLEGRLAETNAALARMEDGSYGKCVSCEGDMEEGRLRAYPSAKECMACLRK